MIRVPRHSWQNHVLQHLRVAYATLPSSWASIFVVASQPVSGHVIPEYVTETSSDVIRYREGLGKSRAGTTKHLSVRVRVRSTLFRQGSPISTWLVSKGALRKLRLH